MKKFFFFFFLFCVCAVCAVNVYGQQLTPDQRVMQDMSRRLASLERDRNTQQGLITDLSRRLAQVESAGTAGLTERDVKKIVRETAVMPKGDTVRRLEGLIEKAQELGDKALTETWEGDKALLTALGATTTEVATYLGATGQAQRLAVVQAVVSRFKADTVAGVKQPDLTPFMKSTDADAKFVTKGALDEEISGRKAGDEAVRAEIPKCKELAKELADTMVNALVDKGYLTKDQADGLYDPKGAADGVKTALSADISKKADQTTVDQISGTATKAYNAVAILTVRGFLHGPDGDTARKTLGITEKEAKDLAEKGKAMGLK